MMFAAGKNKDLAAPMAGNLNNNIVLPGNICVIRENYLGSLGFSAQLGSDL